MEEVIKIFFFYLKVFFYVIVMFDENGEFFVNIGEVYLIYKMFCDSFDVEFFI